MKQRWARTDRLNMRVYDTVSDYEAFKIALADLDDKENALICMKIGIFQTTDFIYEKELS